MDGTEAGERVELPATCGDTVWRTSQVAEVQLRRGSVQMRLHAEQGGFQLKALEVSRAKAATE